MPLSGAVHLIVLGLAPFSFHRKGVHPVSASSGKTTLRSLLTQGIIGL
jgi:hypothetical protein